MKKNRYWIKRDNKNLELRMRHDKTRYGRQGIMHWQRLLEYLKSENLCDYYYVLGVFKQVF